MVRGQAAGATARNKVTGPRSLMRLLRLFDALAKSKDGLSLSELNLILSSPKSSLLNLLRPLVADTYLSYDNGRYRLGPSVFRLAASIMSAWNLTSTLRPFLEELTQRSRESVFVGVLDKIGKVMTNVDVIESPHSVRFSVPIGGIRPLYSTAAGRVLLAYADETFQEDYFRTVNLARLTSRTLTSRKAVREELERIRKTKISVSLGGTFAESAAIASPIFGAEGQVIAALAIGAPTERLQARLGELRPLIFEVAARASGGGSNIREAVIGASVEDGPPTRKRGRGDVVSTGSQRASPHRFSRE
jgi:IclR family transcriptional regulator, acetate operon repressor